MLGPPGAPGAAAGAWARARPENDAAAAKIAQDIRIRFPIMFVHSPVG